jgi:hypothetical protein
MKKKCKYLKDQLIYVTVSFPHTGSERRYVHTTCQAHEVDKAIKQLKRNYYHGGKEAETEPQHTGNGRSSTGRKGPAAQIAENQVRRSRSDSAGKKT